MGSVELGHELRLVRGERNLSLRALAKLTPMSLSRLHELEQGRVAEPRVATLQRLARALDVPPERLLRAAGYL